jgi:carbonyl reductase 1
VVSIVKANGTSEKQSFSGSVKEIIMSEQTKIRVVTGASRGIGLEICWQLARLFPEDRLILTCRDRAVGQSLLREFHDKGHHQVDFVELDVTSQESAHQLALYLSRECQGFDVLINNAGYASKGSHLDSEIAQRTLDVNFFGVQRVTRELLPMLRPHGRVVNVSSGAGILTDAWSETRREALMNEGLTLEHLTAMMHEFLEDVAQDRIAEAGWPHNAYRVSKAGLNALTRVWAKTWEEKDFSVFAVCPGWVKTDMRHRKHGRSAFLWCPLRSGGR